MDISHILDGLNESQRDAVSAPLSNALVIAGAGSGKTRVLVHRIAWLIDVEGVSPHGILAVTFTNKAAAELRARTKSLLNVSARSAGWYFPRPIDCARLGRGQTAPEFSDYRRR